MYRAKINRLRKKVFREAFVKAHLAQGLAHQIRILRNQRGWTQLELAEKLGLKGQSAVARMEDPSYGKLSIGTLIKLSNVFDVALSVKFESFGKFLLEHEDLSPEALKADNFENDRLLNALENNTDHYKRSIVKNFVTPNSLYSKAYDLGRSSPYISCVDQSSIIASVWLSNNNFLEQHEAQSEYLAEKPFSTISQMLN
jgi:transcriptional regulator with XRE-family HTH domain